MSFGSNLVFSTANNHGKWAIAYKKGTTNVARWFCEGDINSMLTQRHRGGGALCMVDDALWSKLNDHIIVDYDKNCE